MLNSNLHHSKILTTNRYLLIASYQWSVTTGDRLIVSLENIMRHSRKCFNAENAARSIY